MKSDKSRATTAEELERGTLRGRSRRVVRAVLLSIFRVVPRVRLENVDRVPATGGVLVVSNHLHNADPIFLDTAYPRPLHIMAKKEAFSFPLFRFFLEIGGAFPVDRGKSDRSAIRRSQATLAAGIAVGLFPEGTRSPTRALQKAHSGAGLISLLADVPVQPVVITGTERLPLNGSKGKLGPDATSPDPGHSGVRILFGDLFLVPREIDGRKTTSAEATEIIMIEIARLLPPSFRGFYADLLDKETHRRALPFAG